MPNTYGNLIAPWKAQLIIERARARGFRDEHDLQDAQQHVVLAVRRFRYDRQKANGQSERSALIGLIDRNLNQLLRSRYRHQRHVFDDAKWLAQRPSPNPRPSKRPRPRSFGSMWPR